MQAPGELQLHESRLVLVVPTLVADAAGLRVGDRVMLRSSPAMPGVITIARLPVEAVLTDPMPS
jgi:hypothetical protein